MDKATNLQDLGLKNAQAADVPIPSDDADDYLNDPALEQQWAIKAFQQAETYFKLLSSMDPTRLKLTQQDDQIYSRFRESFPDLKVEQLIEDELKSSEGKAKWRSFCEEFKETVEDFSFGTLIRANAKGEYNSENTILVVRVQFYAIEIARNREGFNDSIRQVYGSKNV